MALKNMFSADNCFILAGDIGGTNTTVALMEICDGRIQLRKKQGFASRSISGLEEAIDQALPGFKPELGAAAISSASSPTCPGRSTAKSWPRSLDIPSMSSTIFPASVTASPCSIPMFPNNWSG
jgi:hypothetical protein